MKKKLITAIVTLAMSTTCAFGLSGCALFGGGSEHEHEYASDWAFDETYHWRPCLADGKCDEPKKDKGKHVDPNRLGTCEVCGERVIIPQDAPVEIEYDYTDTTITVYRAYYDEDKTTSAYTEYRLDDGEWKQPNASKHEYLYYTELDPASTHTLYARLCERTGYALGETFSVSITLKKSFPASPPTSDAISYEVTGKTVAFTLSDGVELSVDGGETYSAESKITHTFPVSGNKDILIRYSETATHLASGYIRIKIKTTDFARGDGTENDPYIISTLEHFKGLKDLYETSDCYFAMTDDIEWDDEVWEQGHQLIRNLHFDGRGHKITGLKQKEPLFDSAYEVKNLTIENAVYSDRIEKSSIANPAIIAGDLNYAENVNVSGTITVLAPEKAIELGLSGRFSMAVGGICARLVQSRADDNYGMSRCNADITVSLPNIKEKAGVHLELNLGGLAGIVVPYNTKDHNDLAAVSRCSANLNVTQAYVSDSDIGGLLGGFANSNDFGPTANITNCYTTGTVNINFYSKDDNLHSGTLRAGGIAPEITGSISTCYSAIDFNIDAYVTKSQIGACSSVVYVGGICTNAHSNSRHTDSINQQLSRCLFAGSINVKNPVADDVGSYNLNAVCANYANFDSTQELYYKSTVVEPADDAKTVSGDGALAVDESEMMTAAWQKQTLHFSDEYYWALEDGKLPTLK
ncbi:MAG: hypothetical protein HDT28_01540 [Clostridiales bacterium]|nr:hypothetical protein [Clostridiales bacterium]